MQVARLASFLLAFLPFALKNASGSFMLSRLQSIRNHTLSMCHDGRCPQHRQTKKTLHTLQGMTAQPGLKAHWSFPPNLPSKTKWLATYVMLSRPRSLQNLISFGLPERSLLEGGPPADLVECLDEAKKKKQRSKLPKLVHHCAGLLPNDVWQSTRTA